MKRLLKNKVLLGIASAVCMFSASSTYAATYEVIDKGSVEKFEYTYGKRQNNQGVMAVTGANVYNFPVQYEYLNDADFYNITVLSIQTHDQHYGLEPIEDPLALLEGNPTANDLAWVKLYLQSRNVSSTNPYFEYQIVGEVVAMTNEGVGSESTELCVFDSDFEGNNCQGTLTRSTTDSIEGITEKGIAYGNATAPYLAMEPFTDSNSLVRQFWLREHGTRGFFAPDNGTIYPVPPIESNYGGGISTVFDMNENDVAVGYTSYKLSEGREEAVNDEDTGCVEPNSFNVPWEICLQFFQSSMYHLQAYKATLSASGEVTTDLLGLLVNPHEDDIRAFSSQALAINNNGVAVGYAHGWDAGIVENPTSTQQMTGSYAVMFREGEVLDFNQTHYIYASTAAQDINDNGLVVGYAEDIDTRLRRFFYVDTNVPDDEMTIVKPTGFFNSSASTAYSVNSLGVIVGEAEIESHNASSANPRRTTGFIYDAASDTPEIKEINTFLECSSPYNVFKANDINDVGEISATAVVTTDQYDAKGEIVLDDSGNPKQIDVVRAVLLVPVEGGEVEDCSSTEEKVERQGATATSLVLLYLMGVLGFRRLSTKLNR